VLKLTSLVDGCCGPKLSLRRWRGDMRRMAIRDGLCISPVSYVAGLLACMEKAFDSTRSEHSSSFSLSSTTYRGLFWNMLSKPVRRGGLLRSIAWCFVRPWERDSTDFVVPRLFDECLSRRPFLENSALSLFNAPFFDCAWSAGG